MAPQSVSHSNRTMKVLLALIFAQLFLTPVAEHASTRSLHEERPYEVRSNILLRLGDELRRGTSPAPPVQTSCPAIV